MSLSKSAVDNVYDSIFLEYGFPSEYIEVYHDKKNNIYRPYITSDSFYALYMTWKKDNNSSSTISHKITFMRDFLSITSDHFERGVVKINNKTTRLFFIKESFYNMLVLYKNTHISLLSHLRNHLNSTYFNDDFINEYAIKFDDQYKIIQSIDIDNNTSDVKPSGSSS
jgi:hypothetical protein